MTGCTPSPMCLSPPTGCCRRGDGSSALGGSRCAQLPRLRPVAHQICTLCISQPLAPHRPTHRCCSGRLRHRPRPGPSRRFHRGPWRALRCRLHRPRPPARPSRPTFARPHRHRRGCRRRRRRAVSLGFADCRRRPVPLWSRAHRQGGVGRSGCHGRCQGGRFPAGAISKAICYVLSSLRHCWDMRSEEERTSVE